VSAAPVNTDDDVVEDDEDDSDDNDVAFQPNRHVEQLPEATVGHAPRTTPVAGLLAKVAAQEKVIAALSAAKISAERSADALRDTLGSTTEALCRATSELADARQLARQAEVALAFAPASSEDTDVGRRRVLREAQRTVTVVRMAMPLKPHSAVVAEATTASAKLLRASETECAHLQSRILSLEVSVREAVADAAAQRALKAREDKERDLEDELLKAKLLLDEGSGQWEIKQKELSRLRTLMRFSLLKKDSDQLQAVTDRNAELERLLERKQHGDVNRDDYRRLRLLEAHCTAMQQRGATDLNSIPKDVLPRRDETVPAVASSDVAAAGPLPARPPVEKSPAKAHPVSLGATLPTATARPEAVLCDIEGPPTIAETVAETAADAPSTVADEDVPFNVITDRMQLYLARRQQLQREVQEKRDADTAKKRPSTATVSRPRTSPRAMPSYPDSKGERGPTVAASLSMASSLAQRLQHIGRQNSSGYNPRGRPSSAHAPQRAVTGSLASYTSRPTPYATPAASAERRRPTTAGAARW
jgi:hypothetical protein